MQGPFKLWKIKTIFKQSRVYLICFKAKSFTASLKINLIFLFHKFMSPTIEYMFFDTKKEEKKFYKHIVSHIYSHINDGVLQ